MSAGYLSVLLLSAQHPCAAPFSSPPAAHFSSNMSTTLADEDLRALCELELEHQLSLSVVEKCIENALACEPDTSCWLEEGEVQDDMPNAHDSLEESLIQDIATSEQQVHFAPSPPLP